MIESKFSVLDTVRDFSYKKVSGATLSIGVGKGEVMLDCDVLSKQALDMAQSRGGDQTAIKTNSEFEFFGGVSKGVEKRAKVRARIIASAIKELAEGSDCVLLMGHRFSDFDAVGACVGLCAAMHTLALKAFVVIDKSKTLASGLVNKLTAEGFENLFVSPEEAENLITPKTLCIVADTHRPDFTESTSLLKKASNVVVIDHHRKNVDYITKAIIFYNEPGASSACEMATELIQYLLPGKQLDKSNAEALLSGIMLDTKNFTLRAGVRTFEAAAYLKGCGAEMFNVKKLFFGTLAENKIKNETIAKSAVYKGCAISSVVSETEQIRIIASKAADEMLDIAGVKASFVLFSQDGVQNISARSYGELNVQIIMEILGGGGHQTMAAAQLKLSSVDEAVKALCLAIDKYFL
jgi:c-di-AMP phosphodiesterase-like protein